MVGEYDLVIANGTWKLVDYPTSVNPLVANGFIKLSMKKMVKFIITNKDLWLKDFL